MSQRPLAQQLAQDGKAGFVGAAVFINEYLSLANSAAGGSLAQDLPTWVGRTSLRCVLAVIVACAVAQCLSHRPRHLSGPRASPMLVYGWLLWVGWQQPTVHALGLQGLSLVAAGLVLVAGATQVMLALFKSGPWLSRTLSSLVIGASLFAGAIGMISSEVGKLATCAPSGNWRGLLVAGSVVGLNLVWRFLLRNKAELKNFGMLVGMAGACGIYFIWRHLDPDPGFCRTLGSVAADPQSLLEWLPWGHLVSLLADARVLLLVSLGGVGLGVICTTDTFSALTMLDASDKDLRKPEEVSLNRELLVNGLANLGCGLFCLPPVAVSLSRSKLQCEQDCGQRAALFHALTLAAALAFGLGLVALMPRAVLAGCVVLVAMDMLSEPMRTLVAWTLHEQQRTPLLGRAVLLMLLVVGVSLVVHNSAIGMLCGLALSWLGLLLIRPRATAEVQPRGDALTLKLSGDWLFFNTPAAVKDIEAQLENFKTRPPNSALVLRLEHIGMVDFLALSQLKKALGRWTNQGLRPLGIEPLDQVPDDVLRVLWHQGQPTPKA